MEGSRSYEVDLTSFAGFVDRIKHVGIACCSYCRLGLAVASIDEVVLRQRSPPGHCSSSALTLFQNLGCSMAAEKRMSSLVR